MFGIGFQELIVIMIVALIVLGPQRLPEAAKTIAKFIREIKGAVDEVKSSVVDDISSVKDLTQIDLDITQESEKKEKQNTEENFEKEFKKEIKREKISFKKEEDTIDDKKS
ncbi:MAG: twin-arginine translocase subunit TatB [Aquificae bacterium]|nr:twin-arginine translocase subunit TatB [Aquificota bacterium]